MKLTLETDRLILRPFELDDAESMFNNWANDEEVTKYLTWNTHKSIEETKQVLAFWVNQYEKEERINFAIVYKENNELIGGIDVVGYLEGVPVIGYNLSRKYWNKGIMSEACKKVIELLFSLNHEKIIIEAMVENIGSNRVIQKCGGVYDSTYDDYIPRKEKTVAINKYIVYR
jgi:ribosomal-protein-alanine N-acetyltransferase